MKRYNIFFDASCKEDYTQIGILELKTKEQTIIRLDKKLTSGEGEEKAFLLAKEWAKKTFPDYSASAITFFTDNHAVYTKYLELNTPQKAIIWIPREVNKAADRLSKAKTTLGNKSISQFIKETYSLEKRLKLLLAFDNSKRFNHIITSIKNKTKIKVKVSQEESKLIMSFLSSKEVKGVNRKKLTIASSHLKQNVIIQKLTELKEQYAKNV